MAETALSSHIQIEAGNFGSTLLRNNNGAAYDTTGRLIRYGLGHIAPNSTLRSSDLIGWTCVVVTPEMVGKTVAIFTAVEVKKPGWTKPSGERELAQEKFLNLVRHSGGLSTFAKSVKCVADLLNFIKR